MSYRVSHIEVSQVNQLWGVEGSIILFILFIVASRDIKLFLQPVFKKITSAGLNSLRQKECQILVKNWIFDDPFHSMSSSCRTSTKEIWAAFFRQTFRAESEWFWAASSTATVQVNTKKVKLDILLLIFSSWNSLYTKNKNYQT